MQIAYEQYVQQHQVQSGQGAAQQQQQFRETERRATGQVGTGAVNVFVTALFSCIYCMV